jgi:hypothetical protein
MSITYCECVFVALGIQHAMRTSRLTASSVAFPPLQYFSTSPHKRHDLEKESRFLDIKRVFSFSIQVLPETSLILRRTVRHIIKNVCRSSCKYPLFLSDFNETWIFSINFSKKNPSKYQISWKSVQWEPSWTMPTDRHDKAKRHFSQFCESAYRAPTYKGKVTVHPYRRPRGGVEV